MLAESLRVLKVFTLYTVKCYPELTSSPVSVGRGKQFKKCMLSYERKLAFKGVEDSAELVEQIEIKQIHRQRKMNQL